MNEWDFALGFKTLTGYEPLPWQTRMYQAMVNEPPESIPERVALPTGLGKTNVIACWLLALMRCPGEVPRRLVYVVNRRTVVDQTTAEVQKINARINDLGGWFDEVKLSTLRGQYADNREWSADPSCPAVICGTVDMIGSRLLFSGYGVGFKTKPLHAGFLGQDVLLVHDEAHLEPAFQKLIEAVAAEQQREQDRTGFGRPMRVMELSATVRQQDEAGPTKRQIKPFALEDEDRAHGLVGRRINAVKRLKLYPCDDKPEERIIALALEHESEDAAVLVFVRSVKGAAKIADALESKTRKLKDEPSRVQSLTGTMRGKEREGLMKSDPVFRRFIQGESDDGVVAQTGTVYLVATSAGEVGVNLSADHMVCDLTTFESMAQRLGRVNRFGERDDTRVDVVYPTDLPDEEAVEAEQAKKPGAQKQLVYYDAARRRTLELLTKLEGDVSPSKLEGLDQNKCAAAYCPLPRMLDTSDILFDAWAMTSITPPLADTPLPGCPPVMAYLHGIVDWEPPRTSAAWRKEVDWINSPELLEKYPPAALLADYPLKPHELLQDTTERVYEALTAMASRLGDKAGVGVWVLEQRGRVEPTTLAKLLNMDKKRLAAYLAEKTILLAPSAGGLTGQGMLDFETRGRKGERTPAQDVADCWVDKDDRPWRVRVLAGEEPVELREDLKKMRRVRRIELPVSSNADADAVIIRDWYVRPASAEEAGSRSARFDQKLQHHLDRAEQAARAMVARLGLDETEASAVIHAAAWHDLGKGREVWQRSIGNFDRDNPLAKSSGPMLTLRLSRYRHEFGSALDVLDREGPYAQAYNALDEPTRDLLIHLILSHHGRARPHLPHDECYDPKAGRDDAARALAAETPRRYARLQRKYGRWYLAYLESLVRAADRQASQRLDAEQETASTPREVSA